MKKTSISRLPQREEVEERAGEMTTKTLRTTILKGTVLIMDMDMTLITAVIMGMVTTDTVPTTADMVGEDMVRTDTPKKRRRGYSARGGASSVRSSRLAGKPSRASAHSSERAGEEAEAARATDIISVHSSLCKSVYADCYTESKWSTKFLSSSRLKTRFLVR